MKDPLFLRVQDALVQQARHIATTGGLGTSYDNAKLDSAIHAVCSRYLYTHCDLFDLAAYYVFHVAKGHAFIDGNKRTGLSLALTFLKLNGATNQYFPTALELLVLGVCEDIVSPDQLATYLRQNSYRFSALLVARAAVLLTRNWAIRKFREIS